MIVVDDGSTDTTAAIVEAIDDPPVSLISRENGGMSVARNHGLVAYRVPLVTFLDGDDLLLPDALDRMFATMAAHPDRVAYFRAPHQDRQRWYSA